MYDKCHWRLGSGLCRCFNVANTPQLQSYLPILLRMCGVDVDLDDGGSGEEEKEEDIWIGEGVKMLPPPVAHSGGSAWGSRRGRCGCLAWGVVIVLWNLCIIVVSALLLALVFAAVLLPAMLLLYAGFLCHSRVSMPQGQHNTFAANSCQSVI